MYELHKMIYPIEWILTVPLTGAEVTQASDVVWCLHFLFCLKISEWDWRVHKMALGLTFCLLSREYLFFLVWVGRQKLWGQCSWKVRSHFSIKAYTLFDGSFFICYYLVTWLLQVQLWSVLNWWKSAALCPFPGCTPPLLQVSTWTTLLGLCFSLDLPYHCGPSHQPLNCVWH